MEEVELKQPSVKWQAKRVESEKNKIRSALEEQFPGGQHDERLKFVCAEIERLGKNNDANEQLKRLIFIITALVHHIRFNGLTAAQIKRLSELAYAILRTQGIQPGSSKLSFLYGELHLALSQIHWKDGEHWLAAWEHQVSHYLSRNAPPGGEAFQNVGRGRRSLRLGHAWLAIEEFKKAEQGEIEANVWNLARLSRIKAMRLQRSFTEVKMLIDETDDDERLTEQSERELIWEKMVLDVVEAQDVKDMSLQKFVESVQKGKSHCQTAYICEVFLWVRSIQSKKWEGRLGKLYNLRRRGLVDVDSDRQFYQSALAIEECYDFDIPLALRLRKLGLTLNQLDELVSVDKVLLVLAAAVRWLIRTKLSSLAALTYAEYCSLSLRLSSGKYQDVLGVLRDVKIDHIDFS